jgi:hypothetical protein
MKNLEEIKRSFETYRYPWVNVITNKTFSSRYLLLMDLKKYLSKSEYKYVYPKKYVYIIYFDLDSIINNAKIDHVSKKFLSPVDNKWYDYNKIASHLRCFFTQETTNSIIYETFVKNDLVPLCCYSKNLLEINDICIKSSRTPHPQNSLFSKYSSNLTKEDYNKIHEAVLNECKDKRLKGVENFNNDSLKRKQASIKIKESRKDLDYSWIKNRTEEQKKIIAKKSSESQKQNILNGTFTPQNNYRTKRRIQININGNQYYFRSSWEVCFYVSNQYLEYESLRIKYELKNEYKIYIPDFIDNKNKIIYELKPKRQYLAQIEKMNGGIQWCINNNYEFIWVNEYNITEYLDKNICLTEEYLLYYNKLLKGIK